MTSEKRRPSCPNWGHGGGGLGDWAMPERKRFFFEVFPNAQSVLLQNIISILLKVRLNGKKTGFETKMHNFLVNVSLHETVASSFRETEESQRNVLRAHFVCS